MYATVSYKADPEKKKASVRDSYKADPEKKKASVRATAIQGRSRKEEGPCTRQLQGRSRKEEGLYATATRPIPKRRRPLYATATTQILNLSNLLKGSDIKRTSRRTVLLIKGRNTRTIQLPLRHLKGIGIGVTPLSDWLNVLPRGSGIAGVTELHYTTQRYMYVMAYCIALALKSYRKMCMQHVYSTHVRDLHKTLACHGDPTVVLSPL